MIPLHPQQVILGNSERAQQQLFSICNHEDVSRRDYELLEPRAMNWGLWVLATKTGITEKCMTSNPWNDKLGGRPCSTLTLLANASAKRNKSLWPEADQRTTSKTIWRTTKAPENQRQVPLWWSNLLDRHVFSKPLSILLKSCWSPSSINQPKSKENYGQTDCP